MPTRWEIVGQSGWLAVHAALLPSGLVLYYGGSEHDQEPPPNPAAFGLFDPETHAIAFPDAAVSLGEVPDFFCSAACMLPSGDVLVAGGTAKYDVHAAKIHGDLHHFTGIAGAWVYRDDGRPMPDAYSKRLHWRAVAPMHRGRFYPTLVTLANGEVVVSSGHPGEDAGDVHEETQLERWELDPETSKWAWTEPFSTTPPLETTAPDFSVFGTRIVPMVYYPRLHLLPNGRIFSSTPLRANDPVVPPGKEHPRMTREFDPVTGTMTTLSAPPPDSTDVTWMKNVYARSSFPSALLPLRPPYYGARILIAGGKQRYVFDRSKTEEGWQPAGAKRAYDMRAYSNLILLPDGKVLLIGGASTERGPWRRWYLIPNGDIGGEDKDAISTPELYDPDTDSWEVLDGPNYAPVPRVYHNVALLLADGRVWLAGSNHDSLRNVRGTRADGKGDARELRMEIFTPPYLLNPDGSLATRPVIDKVQHGCAYQGHFRIYTPDAGAIRSVALIRASAVTHSLNTDQRYVGLAIDEHQSVRTGGAEHNLHVQGPLSGNVAPPGCYFLFIVNDDGVPSIGKSFYVSDAYPIIENADDFRNEHGIYTVDVELGTLPIDVQYTRRIDWRNIGIGDLKLLSFEFIENLGDEIVWDPNFAGTSQPVAAGDRPGRTAIRVIQAAADLGSLVSIEVRFTPHEFGIYTGWLRIRTNAPDTPIIEVKLRAEVKGLRVEISPIVGRMGVDFGSARVGQYTSRTLMVHNTGNVDAGLITTDLSLEQPAGQFKTNDMHTNPLPAGDTTTITMDFMPTQIGPASAVAGLEFEGSPGPSIYRLERDLDLGGVGTAPRIVLIPSDLDFAWVARGTQPTATVRIENRGNEDLQLGVIRVASGSFAFTQLTAVLPDVIAPGDHADLEVQYTPGNAKPGVREDAEWWLESSDPSSPHAVLSMSGGLAGPHLLYPDYLDFEQRAPHAVLPLVMSNTGSTDLHITTIRLETGTAFSLSGTPPFPHALPPATDLTVNVEFLGGVAGHNYDRVVIVSDDAHVPEARVGIHALAP